MITYKYKTTSKTILAAQLVCICGCATSIRRVR